MFSSKWEQQFSPKRTHVIVEWKLVCIMNTSLFLITLEQLSVYNPRLSRNINLSMKVLCFHLVVKNEQKLVFEKNEKKMLPNINSKEERRKYVVGGCFFK